MAITNPILFGLDANRSLSDVKNRNVALKNLNINPLDLEVIYGSRSNVTTHDWRSFSRLEQPLYKTLDRYYTDVNTYEGLLDNRAGSTVILFGGLTINGKLSGNAIRYRYVAGTGNNAETKIADISTSRVSAWSSSASPLLDTSPISYGARLGLRSGGQLKFAHDTTGPTGSGEYQLKTSITPQRAEFRSEIPTSRITAEINGKTIEMYAMKGIPVRFRGFFRNVSCSTANQTVDTGGGPIPPSFKITRVDGGHVDGKFVDTNNMYFSSVRSRERYVEIYFPPDKLTQVTLSSASIFEFPTVKFDNLDILNMQWNNIRDFPNLTERAPILTELNLSHNYFYQSENSSERRFNAAIANKMPNTLEAMYMGGTFYGSIEQNIIADRFTSLKTFHLQRNGRGYFHADSNDQSSGSCTCPNVPNTVTYYNIYGNSFSRFDTGANGTSRRNPMQLTAVTELQLGSNYYLSTPSGTDFEVASPDIKYLYMYSTGLRCPNLSGKTEFLYLGANHTRNFGTFFTNASGGDGDEDTYETNKTYSGYKFSLCNKLDTIDVNYSSVRGPLPDFVNSELKNFYAWGCSLHGGDPSIAGGGTYVISNTTFASATKIRTISINSSNLLRKEIHEDAFSNLTSLSTLNIVSHGKITGSIPTLSSCGSLTEIYMPDNAFTSGIPGLSSLPNIHGVYLHSNKLRGTVPAIKDLSSLTYLYLHNNTDSSDSAAGVSGLTSFENLPNLQRLYLHNNRIGGEILDFSECPNMRYLILYNNQFSSYKKGSFSQLYRIRIIDVSYNKLNSTDIDNIVDDLYDNYESAPRGGISINITENKPQGYPTPIVPSPEQIDKIDILKVAGWQFKFNR